MTTTYTRTDEQKRVRRVRDRLRRSGFELRNNGHVAHDRRAQAPIGWIETTDGTRLSLFSITKDGISVKGLTSGGMPTHSIT